MAEFKCSGDCINCGPAQRIYCAAQRSFAMLNNQQSILAQLAEIREILSREETVTPLDEAGTDDVGAENKTSKK